MTPLVSQSIARVQAWLAGQSHKDRLHIAEQADIDEKTLRLANSPDWDPRASTLRKLEPLVPSPRKAKRRAA